METSMKPRVFITNYAGHNYKGAKDYGDLVSLTRGYISFGSLDRVKYSIAEVIIKETTKDDWLLLSGVPMISALAAAIWYARHQCVKMLVWDKKNPDGPYREVVFDEENFLDMVKEIALENGKES